MCYVLCTGTQREHGKNFRARVDSQPEPGAQLVQLQVRKVEVTEAVLVQGLCMFPCAREPGGDRGLSVAEDPLGSRKIQPFGQRGEHQCDLPRGGFQTVQGSVAPGSERGAASLTTKRLDLFGLAMFAVANQRMSVRVCHTEVGALVVGTGVAFGVDPLGGSSSTFHLAPGPHRPRGRSHNSRVGAREATGGAVQRGSWLKEALGCGADGPSW